jgi:hypothetical protein
MRSRLTVSLALLSVLLAAPALAQSPMALIGPTAPTSDNSDRLATTAWVNNLVTAGLPLASGNIWIGSAGNIATAQNPSGDCTLSLSGVITCTQAAGNFLVIGNLSVGGSIIDGNGILFTNIVAPATPAAGTTRGYVDSTTKIFTAKNDAAVLSNTVVPSTAGANTFATGISAAGAVTYSAIAANSISRGMEAQGIARSVVGVTGNGSANVADIQGTANQALVVNSGGTALTFGAVNLAAAAAVTGALPNVSLQGSVAAPTGTVSATEVMQGLGTTCKLTPAYSGRVNVSFTGFMSGTGTAVVGEVDFYWGTGTAPTNGVAPTGTKVGSQIQNFVGTSGTAGSIASFPKNAVITGLTPGTAYWFDLGLGSNNGQNVSIKNVDCSGFEF